jgi:hypothetical protein
MGAGGGGGGSNPFKEMAETIKDAAVIQSKSADKAMLIAMDQFDQSLNFMKQQYGTARDDMLIYRKIGHSATESMFDLMGLNRPKEMLPANAVELLTREATGKAREQSLRGFIADGGTTEAKKGEHKNFMDAIHGVTDDLPGPGNIMNNEYGALIQRLGRQLPKDHPDRIYAARLEAALNGTLPPGETVQLPNPNAVGRVFPQGFLAAGAFGTSNTFPGSTTSPTPAWGNAARWSIPFNNLQEYNAKILQPNIQDFTNSLDPQALANLKEGGNWGAINDPARNLKSFIEAFKQDFGMTVRDASEDPNFMAQWKSLALPTQLEGGGDENDPVRRERSLRAITDNPDYQFRLKEGLSALQNSAAAKGTLDSGASMKAITEYGQGMAAASYADRIQYLSNLMNIGQNSAALSANQAMQMGNKVTEMRQQLSDTLGSGMMAKGNVLAHALMGAKRWDIHGKAFEQQQKNQGIGMAFGAAGKGLGLLGGMMGGGGMGGM